MQDYKSLCAAVMIDATLVNIQTHRDSILNFLISWAKNLIADDFLRQKVHNIQ